MAGMITSWKTTLVGILVGFLNLWAGGTSPKNAAVSVGIALLGAVAKDFNTHGT